MNIDSKKDYLEMLETKYIKKEVLNKLNLLLY